AWVSEPVVDGPPPPPPSPAASAGFVALRSRDFRLLLGGQLVSLTGTQMQQVAVVWQLYLLSGSPLALGMLGFFRVAPIVLFALGGGVLADALDRRKLMTRHRRRSRRYQSRWRSFRIRTGRRPERSTRSRSSRAPRRLSTVPRGRRWCRDWWRARSYRTPPASTSPSTRPPPSQVPPWADSCPP